MSKDTPCSIKYILQVSLFIQSTRSIKGVLKWQLSFSSAERAFQTSLQIHKYAKRSLHVFISWNLVKADTQRSKNISWHMAKALNKLRTYKHSMQFFTFGYTWLRTNRLIPISVGRHEKTFDNLVSNNGSLMTFQTLTKRNQGFSCFMIIKDKGAVANPTLNLPKHSQNSSLPSTSNKEYFRQFEEVFDSLELRGAPGKACGALREDFAHAHNYCAARLYMRAARLCAMVAVTQQSHPTAHVHGAFSFKRVVFVVTPPTAFKVIVTHKQRFSS